MANGSEQRWKQSISRSLKNMFRIKSNISELKESNQVEAEELEREMNSQVLNMLRRSKTELKYSKASGNSNKDEIFNTALKNAVTELMSDNTNESNFEKTAMKLQTAADNSLGNSQVETKNLNAVKATRAAVNEIKPISIVSEAETTETAAPLATAAPATAQPETAQPETAQPETTTPPETATPAATTPAATTPEDLAALQLTITNLREKLANQTSKTRTTEQLLTQAKGAQPSQAQTQVQQLQAQLQKAQTQVQLQAQLQAAQLQAAQPAPVVQQVRTWDALQGKLLQAQQEKQAAEEAARTAQQLDEAQTKTIAELRTENERLKAENMTLRGIIERLPTALSEKEEANKRERSGNNQALNGETQRLKLLMRLAEKEAELEQAQSNISSLQAQLTAMDSVNTPLTPPLKKHLNDILAVAYQDMVNKFILAIDGKGEVPVDVERWSRRIPQAAKSTFEQYKGALKTFTSSLLQRTYGTYFQPHLRLDQKGALALAVQKIKEFIPENQMRKQPRQTSKFTNPYIVEGGMQDVMERMLTTATATDEGSSSGQ